MSRKRHTAALVVGVLLTCLAALVIVRLISRSESSAHATEPLPAGRTDAGNDDRDLDLVGSLTAGSVKAGREAGERPSDTSDEESGANDVDGSSVDELGELLDRLRARSNEADFHAAAWPLVLGLSGLMAEGDPARAERARRVRTVAFDDGEHERVRSACTVAVAMARCDDAVEIADGLAQAMSGEVQRGGWLARGVLSTGEAGLSIELRRFESRRSTFPVTVMRTSADTLVLEAFERTERVMPAGTEGFTEENIAARLEEAFTRQVVVLSVLGPAVRWPGEVRERMMRWLEEPTREAGAVRPAALHCLALAARKDDELARRLVVIANAHLFELDGTKILDALANIADRSDLVLSALVEFFRGSDAIEEPRRTLAHANALVALEGVLASENEEVRQQAIALAMERILDPGTEAFDRTLFLTMLSGTEAGSGVLFDILSLAAASGDPNELATELSLMGAVPDEQHPATHAFLVQLLGNPGTTVELRRSIYTQIAAIAAPGALDVIHGQLAVETDPELRALLERLETELGG